MFGKLTKTQKERIKLQRKAQRRKLSLQIEAEALASLFSYIAGSDGAITREETNHYSSFLAQCRADDVPLPRGLESAPVSVTDREVTGRVRSYVSACRPTVAARKGVHRALCQLAASDAPINNEEKLALDVVAELLQLKGGAKVNRGRFDRYAARSGGEPDSSTRAGAGVRNSSRVHPPKAAVVPWCYQVLGCTEDDTDEVVKRAYRRLASVLHPDKHVAGSASSDRIRIHQEDFQKLQEAYEEIRRRRATRKAASL
jgi:DnaJ-domain-containing protein 1